MDCARFAVLKIIVASNQNVKTVLITKCASVVIVQLSVTATVTVPVAYAKIGSARKHPHAHVLWVNSVQIEFA